MLKTVCLLLMIAAFAYWLLFVKSEVADLSGPSAEISPSLNISTIDQDIPQLVVVRYKERQYFFDHFDEVISIEENNGVIFDSNNKYWRVNSGAYLYVEGGIGKTVQGELPMGSEWQKRYRDYNASETDNGQHPQNIFRLVTTTKWKDFRQEAYYKINRYILSVAKERSESNGLLLFNRYQDGDNLYYTGIRVDGAAVIKKKIRGQYFTMAYETIYPGKYNRKKNPNLLPVDKWIGVRSEVVNGKNGSVNIRLYIDRERNGNWELVAEAIDDGRKFGGKAIINEGYAGVRTDFMDAEFDDYRIEER